jgi:hemin uptake protein HemP
MSSKSPVTGLPDEERPDDGAPRTPADASDDGAVPAIDSRTILGGKTEVIIKHHDQLYRLRLTKAGRLLLNK